MSKKLPRWVEEVYPEYVVARIDGESSQDAAEGILGNNRNIEVGIETFLRYMRWYKADSFKLQAGELPDGLRAISVPPPIRTDHLPALIVPYEDVMVFGDFHIPLHDHEMINYAFSIVRDREIKTAIISGDFLNMEWASKFVSWGQAGPIESKIEFEIARKILNTLLGIVNKIYIIPGNHDGGRFKNMSKGALGFEMLLRAMVGPEVLESRRIQFTERRWMVMEGSPHGDWRITHPSQGRANPLSLAQALAAKYKMNLLTAHQHYLGMTYDKTGEYICVDGGHMQNEQLADYMVEVDSTHSRWIPGFVELRGGWPHLYPRPTG
jgi:predicted phosphodiesterase